MAHSVVTLGLHQGSIPVSRFLPLDLCLWGGGKLCQDPYWGETPPDYCWLLTVMSCHVYDPAACSLYCYRPSSVVM